ncbi:hypothetical protein KR054_008095, partial [Drosophila jambulina]
FSKAISKSYLYLYLYIFQLFSGRTYMRNLYEKARGKENIHFLKLQREQLKTLRQSILSQKNEVTTKMIKVDTQIQSLEKTNQPDGSQK